MNATTPPAFRHSSTAVLAYRSRRSRSRRAAVAVAVTLAAGLTLGGLGVQHLLPRPVQAQEALASRAGERAGIAVIGEGTARAKPDTITLRLGVEVNAQTPTAALARTRETTERVLQRLRDQGVAEADLQTTGLNVFRVQDGPPPAPTVPNQVAPTPYRGFASVGVKVADVARAGALLEAAMQAGATSVEGLGYALRDDSQLRLVAITDAIRNARPRAEAAAAAAGLRLGGVRAVAEIDGTTQPRPERGGGAGEGLAPGETEVVALVRVTFDVL